MKYKLAIFIFAFALANGSPIADWQTKISADPLQIVEDVDSYGFDLEFSSALEPFVSTVCAGLRYIQVFPLTEDRLEEVVTTMDKTFCSKLPDDSVFDFTPLKECLENWECVKTTKMEFLAGISEDFSYYSFFNVTEFKKQKSLLEECKAIVDCDVESQAHNLVKNSLDVLQNCENAQEEEAVQSIHALGMYEQQVDKQKGYQEHVLRCMQSSPSQSVKEAGARALQRGAICSQEAVDQAMEYLEHESTLAKEASGASGSDPMPVIMSVVEQLMNCENNTDIPDFFQKVLNDAPEDSKTGAAVWEMLQLFIQSADDEESLDRDVRSSDMYKVAESSDLNSELTAKWKTNKFAKSFTYETPSGGLGYPTKTTYVFMNGGTPTGPLTLRILQDKGAYGLSHTVDIVLDSPFVEEIWGFVSGKTWLECLPTLFAKFSSGDVTFPETKISIVTTDDQIDVTNPQVMEMFQKVYQKLMESFVNIVSLGDKAYLKASNFENGAAFDFSYNFNRTGDQSLDANFSLTVEGGVNLVDFSFHLLPIEIETPEAYEPMSPNYADNNEFKSSYYYSAYFDYVNSYSLPKWGFNMTAAIALMDHSLEYDAAVQYKPMEDWTDASEVCESYVSVRNRKADRDIASFKGCSRPLYLTDVNELVPTLSSFSRVFEISDLVKFNFTFDLGSSGLGDFMATSKQLMIRLDYLNELLAEFALQTKLASSGPVKQTSQGPMFTLETLATVKIPFLTEGTTEFSMETEIYDDQSTVSSFAVKAGELYESVDPKVGQIRTTSCSKDTENFFSNLMVSQDMTMPTEWCYDLEFNYSLDSNDVIYKERMYYNTKRYHYNSTFSYSDSSTAMSGHLTLETYFFPYTFEYEEVYTAPIPFTFHIGNNAFEYYINYNDPEAEESLKNDMIPLPNELTLYINNRGVAIILNSSNAQVMETLQGVSYYFIWFNDYDPYSFFDKDNEDVVYFASKVNHAQNQKLGFHGYYYERAEASEFVYVSKPCGSGFKIIPDFYIDHWESLRYYHNVSLNYRNPMDELVTIEYSSTDKFQNRTHYVKVFNDDDSLIAKVALEFAYSQEDDMNTYGFFTSMSDEEGEMCNMLTVKGTSWDTIEHAIDDQCSEEAFTNFIDDTMARNVTELFYSDAANELGNIAADPSNEDGITAFMNVMEQYANTICEIMEELMGGVPDYYYYFGNQMAEILPFQY